MPYYILDMPKKSLERFLPTERKIRSNKLIKFLGSYLNSQHIWRLDKETLSRGVSVGLFCGWLPIPFQMPLSAFFSLLFRANLPSAIILAWFSNPLTSPAVFSFAYFFGCFLLQVPPVEFSMSVIMSSFSEMYLITFFGSFILGTLSSVIGYIITKRWWIYKVRAKRLRR